MFYVFLSIWRSIIEKIVAVVTGCKSIWIEKETLYVYTIPVHFQTITIYMENHL